MATVKRKELLEALNLAGKFCGRTAFTRVCVDMESRKSVRAFSTIGAIEISLPSLSVDCPAFELLCKCPSFEIDAKSLSKVIGKSKAEWLQIEMVENCWLSIKDSAYAEFHIVAHEDRELPLIEPCTQESGYFTVKQSHIESAFRYKVAPDDKRMHVLVVNFTAGKMLSTNGSILYCGYDDIPDGVNVNIHRAVFERIPKSVALIPVSVYENDGGVKMFEISFDNVRISGECVQCTFPDVSDLLQSTSGFHSITINAPALRYAIEQSHGILNEDYKGAEFKFFGGHLSVQAINPELGELAPFNVPYLNDVPIDNVHTAFNPAYIINAITGYRETVNVSIKDENNPVHFDYNDSKTIIMPMRI